MDFRTTFYKHYNKNIQLSVFQIQTIAAAVMTRSPGCNFLVFGLGNDSALWHELNADGETAFLETSEEWIGRIAGQYQGLSVSVMPTFDLTVGTSRNLSETRLARYPIPEHLSRRIWDVILIDAPPSNTHGDPGRAVAIYWASRLATRQTHVFVHDHERTLEADYSRRFLTERRGGCSVVVPPTDGHPARHLLWSMGRPREQPDPPAGTREPITEPATAGA